MLFNFLAISDFMEVINLFSSRRRSITFKYGLFCILMKIDSQTYHYAAFIDLVFVIVTSNASRNNAESIKLTRLCDILAIFTAKKI